MSGFGLPEQASTLAPRVDHLLYAVAGVTGGVALLILILIVTFSLRYRAGAPTPRADDVPGAQARARRRFEIAWTVTPLLLFLGTFVWAARLYVERAKAPADAMELYVVAKQWMWELQHPGGQREIGEMHVPRGRPVKLVMTSQDVIHSFYVPAFRLKQDVLPGRYTEMWFTPTVAGRYHLFCAEYCGTDHSAMRGAVVVDEPVEFERWLTAHRGAADMASRGESLFRQYGCSGCHGPQSTVHAPDLAGLYGRPVVLADGRTVIADESYLRDSILLPQKDVVAGYAEIMPTFAGRLHESEILDLIAYLKRPALAPEQPR